MRQQPNRRTELAKVLDRNWAIQTAARVTNRSEEEAATLLAAEHARPGSTVTAEIQRRGVEPFVWSDKLLTFYKESDAFLFELVGWNRQVYKRSMREWSRWFLRREADRLDRPLDILCHGDGLGIDAAAFAVDGHRVTYFEFPGYSERYARQVFEAVGVDVTVVTDSTRLALAGFDAVTSFDVLEHVPSPRDQVAELVTFLRDPGGLFLVHAPFFLIHHAYPTHLKENRRYAGSLKLYERNGLRLLDGQTAWNPIALRLNSNDGAALPAKRAWLRAAGQGLKIGRYTAAPFVPLQKILRKMESED